MRGRNPKDVYGGRSNSSWYWLDEDGTYYISVIYGKQKLELARGKYAIQCNDFQHMIDCLRIVKEHTLRGELDSQLSNVATNIRKKLKKI